jgi:hypothetical protein
VIGFTIPGKLPSPTPPFFSSILIGVPQKEWSVIGYTIGTWRAFFFLLNLYPAFSLVGHKMDDLWLIDWWIVPVELSSSSQSYP